MASKPNPRLQRTRSAPLRSPLSRKPFGDRRLPKLKTLVLLVLTAIAALGCPIPYGDAWMMFGGTISSASGQPIAGARVELYMDGRPPRNGGVAISGADGKYKFFASSCPCDFQLEIVTVSPGFQTYRKAMRGRKANQLERLDIVLQPEPSAADRERAHVSNPRPPNTALGAGKPEKVRG